MSTNSKLGIKGVYKRYERFHARGQLNGKSYFLGSHATVEEAIAAHAKWEAKIDAEFPDRHKRPGVKPAVLRAEMLRLVDDVFRRLVNEKKRIGWNVVGD